MSTPKEQMAWDYSVVHDGVVPFLVQCKLFCAKRAQTVASGRRRSAYYPKYFTQSSEVIYE